MKPQEMKHSVRPSVSELTLVSHSITQYYFLLFRTNPHHSPQRSRTRSNKKSLVKPSVRTPTLEVRDCLHSISKRCKREHTMRRFVPYSRASKLAQLTWQVALVVGADARLSLNYYHVRLSR